ncbi:ABC transporter substrate-binding protein [Caenispirillum bisanense]|nr:ABC transporter substrate-binding protein [Caenispirillum bisanense]
MALSKGAGRWQSIFAGVSLVLAVSAYGLAAALPDPEHPLRIGRNGWTGYEPLSVAEEAGALDRRRVAVIDLPATTDVLRALRDGVLDGAALTLDEALTAEAAGVDLVIVAVVDVSMGGDVVMARADLQSLVGARVAFEGKALGAYMVGRFLEERGLALTDVLLVEAPVDRHQHLLQTGEVDAAVTFEPYGTALAREGYVQVFSSWEIPGEIVDVLAVRADASATHAEAVEHLKGAWELGRSGIVSRDAEVLGGIAARQGLAASDVADALDLLEFPSSSESDAMLSENSPLREVAQNLWDWLVLRDVAAPGPLPDIFAPAKGE